jgi:hypothetical protein
MLKPGDSYHYLTETSLGETTKDGRVRYGNNPLNAQNTRLIADALTSGFRLVEGSGFRDTVEQTEKGPLRKVEWYIDGSSKGLFVTAEGREEIDFTEFQRRYQSEQWCLEHSHHPISFMRWSARHLSELRDKIRDLTPAAVLRRGNRMVTVPADLPQDKKDKLLSYLK